jgi:hypothetical protein
MCPVSNKEDFKKLIAPELERKLRYEEDLPNKELHIIATEFIGGAEFAELRRIVKELGGVYVPKPKNSYFRISLGSRATLEHENKLEMAKQYELSGRYGEAASIYESMNMYKEAETARQRAAQKPS